MGHYKKLKAWLTRKKTWHKNKSYRLKGSQGARILESLCEGNEVGGREAIILVKSHNAPRRLYYVLKMRRHNGIVYWTRLKQSPVGTDYKVFQILPSDRERARKLIVGKGT